MVAITKDEIAEFIQANGEEVFINTIIQYLKQREEPCLCWGLIRAVLEKLRPSFTLGHCTISDLLYSSIISKDTVPQAISSSPIRAFMMLNFPRLYEYCVKTPGIRTDYVCWFDNTEHRIKTLQNYLKSISGN